LFKDGVEVMREGALVAVPKGVTHVVRPDFDAAIEKRIARFFDDHMSVGFAHFPVSPTELADAGIDLVAHPCRPRGRA
jgi:formylmethanofuran dehydrogenase subunit A